MAHLIFHEFSPLNCHLQHHRNQAYHRLINHTPWRHTNLGENRLWRLPWLDFLFFFWHKSPAKTAAAKEDSDCIMGFWSSWSDCSASCYGAGVGAGLTLPPIIMVQWKMGVSPISVSFQLGWFSNETWLWEKGSVWRMAIVIHQWRSESLVVVFFCEGIMVVTTVMFMIEGSLMMSKGFVTKIPTWLTLGSLRDESARRLT